MDPFCAPAPQWTPLGSHASACGAASLISLDLQTLEAAACHLPFAAWRAEEGRRREKDLDTATTV